MHFSKLIEFLKAIYGNIWQYIVTYGKLKMAKTPKWKIDAHTSCRDLDLLHPTMKKLVLELIQKLKDLGYEIKVIETFRTKERQKLLRKQGKSWIKISYHQRGLACDIVFLTNGKIDWNKPLKDWKKMGKIWKSLHPKAIWGGDWKVKDLVHLQLNL